MSSQNLSRRRSSGKKNSRFKPKRPRHEVDNQEEVDLLSPIKSLADSLDHPVDLSTVALVQQTVGNRNLQRLLNSKKTNNTDGSSQNNIKTGTLQRADQEAQSFNVRHNVQLIPQTSNMSCWAASAAMLVSWRDSISIDDRTIAAGINYWTQYLDGLDPEDVHMFRAWGLVEETPQSFTVEAFRGMLENYGPLWVAADADPGQAVAAHVRVVTGINGDGTPRGTFLTINDPAGPKTSIESYAKFISAQEELAANELSQYEQPIYVAHL